MIEINFDEQFADDVKDGIKIRTIRSKPYCKPGDKLRLCTGGGTPDHRQLREVVCRAVTPVQIRGTEMFLNGRRLLAGNAERDECEDRDNDFARKDGFDGFTEMADYIEKIYGRLPFDGFLIEWRI